MIRINETWVIDSNEVGLIGVGWFDWHLDRAGLSTMTFKTRREAREGLKKVKSPFGFNRACVKKAHVIVKTIP